MTVRRTIIVVNVIAVNRTPPLEVRKSNPEVGLSDFEGGGFRLLLGLFDVHYGRVEHLVEV